MFLHTGMFWLYMDGVKWHIHVVYILTKFVLYVLFAVPIVSHIVSDDSSVGS